MNLSLNCKTLFSVFKQNLIVELLPRELLFVDLNTEPTHNRKVLVFLFHITSKEAFYKVHSKGNSRAFIHQSRFTGIEHHCMCGKLCIKSFVGAA